MSEQDQQRPLTRRELRLREMGETGALDLSEVQDSDAGAEVGAPAAGAPTAEIEISPLNEDGTPRSRREMRQLREEALAAQAAAASQGDADQSATADVDGEPVSEGPSAETDETEPAASTDAPSVPAAPVTGEIDFDSLISPPTEPFTVDELREAEQSAESPAAEQEEAAGEGDTSSVDADPAGSTDIPSAEPDVEPTVEEAPAEAEAEAEAEVAAKPKRRFPWTRNRAEADAEVEVEAEVEAESAAEEVSTEAVAEEAVEEPAAESTEESEPSVEVADVVIEPAEVADDAPETIEVTPEAPVATETDPVIVVPSADDPEALPVSPDAGPSEVPEPAPAAPAAPATEPPAYSFPDIAPPEEWRSVFDDPATRTQPGAADASGDFDDLISRAVAQEGGTASSNTSALILPAMPEDTGGLTGPLGGTGELYVTGSLKLPKSLGETGGHSSLHDSIEFDPITGAATDDPQVTGQGPAPVSARHAVSARMDSSIPVVAKPAKERSKLPLVLSLTGGGLLVAVVALGVWGASNGMFG